MSLPTNSLPVSKEARIQLAIQALELSQIFSLQPAARAFNVPKSSLQTRRARISSRRDIKPKSIKLTITEEETIEQYILELNSRGFAPPFNAIREIANKLLAERQRD